MWPIGSHLYSRAYKQAGRKRNYRPVERTIAKLCYIIWSVSLVVSAMGAARHGQASLIGVERHHKALKASRRLCNRSTTRGPAVFLIVIAGRDEGLTCWTEKELSNPAGSLGHQRNSSPAQKQAISACAKPRCHSGRRGVQDGWAACLVFLSPFAGAQRRALGFSQQTNWQDLPASAKSKLKPLDTQSLPIVQPECLLPKCEPPFQTATSLATVPTPRTKASQS